MPTKTAEQLLSLLRTGEEENYQERQAIAIEVIAEAPVKIWLQMLRR